MDWVKAVTEKAGGVRDDVASILGAYGISGPRPVPSRRNLRLSAVHFAGVKNLRSGEDPNSRTYVPFSFTRAFTTPVTALVSDGKNDAGKSSTLDIVSWGLRGIANVAPDVKKWLRQVCLLLEISGERVLIAWRVDDGMPTGSILAFPSQQTADLHEMESLALDAMHALSDESQLTGAPVFGMTVPVDDLMTRLRGVGAFTVSSFEGDEDMARAINDFMLDRLGLDTLTQWQRNRGATDGDDGTTAEHAWPLWSQALVIAKPSVKSAIGEVPTQAVAVLNTFLATEWSATRSLARAQRRSVDATLAGMKRRRARDADARQAGALELEAERATVQAELDALPTGGGQGMRLVEAVTAATDEITRTQRWLAEAALAYGVAGRAFEAAEHDLAALKEAAVTKRFWHSLKPSCCPRCDAKVQQVQWERELDGACSLCNNPISPDRDDDAPEAPSEEDADPVDLAEEHVKRCAAEAERLSTVHDEAGEAARRAQVTFEEASNALNDAHVDPVKRQTLERRLGFLDGQIQERSTMFGEDPDEERLSAEQAVLSAAETISDAEAKKDFRSALESVSAQITELGKQLGISNLESATLKGNAHLPVVKGGEPTNFGDLTDGERLRLKIALVVALLDVGTTSGLGRHPGLLIVDSLAREELNHENAKLLLTELNRVAEAYGLQVITGTAHSDLVDAVLPDEAVQRPMDTGFMW